MYHNLGKMPCAYQARKIGGITTVGRGKKRATLDLLVQCFANLSYRSLKSPVQVLDTEAYSNYRALIEGRGRCEYSYIRVLPDEFLLKSEVKFISKEIS